MYVFYNTAKYGVLCIIYCFFKTYYFFTVASSIGLGAFHKEEGDWEKTAFITEATQKIVPIKIGRYG